MKLPLPRFKSRVERNIVLMVLLCGVLPLAIVAIVAMREIEQQTLILAEEQLEESTRSYALELLDQIRLAEMEIRLLYLGDWADPDATTVRGFSVIEPETMPQRTVLVQGDDSLLIQVPYRDVVLIGTLPYNQLFADIGEVAYGVQRCIAMNDVPIRCQGADLAPEAALVTASWTLPLPGSYASAIELVVTSNQLRLTALRHVSLVAQILPIAILCIALVIGWFLVLQIRRRMAPLTELQEATWAVRRGDYDHQVELATGDEFERLGRAFNLMTARLGSSFRKMTSLAEIDRLILSGATFEDVTQRALLAAEENSGARCYAYMWDAGPHSGRLYAIDGDKLTCRELTLSPYRNLDMTSALRELAIQLRRPVAISSEICREGHSCGVLFTAAELGDESFEAQTLAELTDRLSVAATNTEREQALYRQANYDTLTGLINRHAFSERLKERVEQAQRQGLKGALLFLDLDRFKHVNDTEGHLIGDELLRVVGKRLLSALRGTDVVGRLGGDEFAVVIPALANEAELVEVCERLIAVISTPITVDRITHSVDVSVGVSLFPDDGADSGTLLMKADVAMYKAKEQKGSAYALFDQSLNEATEQRVHIEGRLREAVERGELSLHFQPKLNLHNDRIEDVEGLLRWPRGDRRALTPDQFIPVAEETGLIHQLTEVLVSETAALLKRSRDAHLGVERVAINISSQQFSREGFADRLLALLSSTGLKCRELELEITESLFVESVEQVTGELKKLRAAGVKIALDDFGTGYSSLNMLRDLPLDTLKIDRSFITPLESSAQARSLASKIVEIARTLKLQVVAEGVQTRQETTLLKKLGCDFVQGFIVSEALPLTELEAFLLKRLEERASRKVVPMSRR